MPDDTKTTRRREAPEPSRLWETTCTALLDGNHQALTQWIQRMQGISEEISTLAEARLRLAMETWSALSACRTPEEFADCHRNLTAKVTELCSAEIAKLSQMTMRAPLVRPADNDAR